MVLEFLTTLLPAAPSPVTVRTKRGPTLIHYYNCTQDPHPSQDLCCIQPPHPLAIFSSLLGGPEESWPGILETVP